MKHNVQCDCEKCLKRYKATITLELANGEALGDHWIYQHGEMKDWYIKDDNPNVLKFKFTKRLQRYPKPK